MGRKLPKFASEKELLAIMRATTRERDRMMLLTLFFFGLRVAELCALEVRDLEFAEQRLWVRSGKGDKDRAVAMPDKMIGPLRGWVAARQDGPVFPSPRGSHLTTRTVQLLIKRLAAKAGLHGAREGRRFTPHKFPAQLRLAAA